MCGIVGYIGNNTTEKTLINMLKKLEYRGYDSAGISVCNGDNIKTTKSVGKIENLEKIITHSKCTCGIAHTRWATHGAVTYENTHPHISQNNEWAIVHNGIVENFSELKTTLIKNNNISFYGETDSEVIAKMLEINNDENNINTLIDVCKTLKGSYALSCINKNKKDCLFLAKNKSPLYVATNKSEIFVASDPICFVGKTTDYYMLEDFEFCEANLKNIVFYNKNKEIIEKLPVKLDNLISFSEKGNFEFFMEKEIYETPFILKRIASEYNLRKILNKINLKFLNNYNKIILIGCGTAYHASLMGARYIETFARIPTSAHIASEYRYSNPIIDKKTLFIFVSQSGETADTLAVCDLAKQHNATCIALTNVLYSSLAKKVDFVLPVCAGPEIAVASTKAYTAQITILYMLARHIQNELTNSNFNYISQIENFAENIQIPTHRKIFQIAQNLTLANSVFFIGRDRDYISSEEASLKLKEITYINSSAYPSGELKHGFLALIDSNTYLFVIATQKALLDKTLNGANEALSRGAKIILVTQFNIPKEKKSKFYKVIKLKKFDEELMQIESILFFQLLALKTCTNKNLNPDQPRNLAKSVTVE